jgi:hypothetical protein
MNTEYADDPTMSPSPIPLDVLGLEAMELWAFLENSDFQRIKNGELYRQDEVRLIRHDEFLGVDYELMKSIGCKGVRDAARWYVTHTAPGKFDWAWLDQMTGAIAPSGMHMYLDLWHYGYPDWLDIMSPDAVGHFTDFARAIAERYPWLQYYCVCNEPSLLVEMGGQKGVWAPFLTDAAPVRFRQQVSRMIISASEAILDANPKAVLVLPEPWHATNLNPEDNQAAVIDSVLGRLDPELDGRDALVSIVGLNHYRDSTLPPFHRLLMNAARRYPDKTLWVTETSGPPIGWQQTEWFWWMMAEVRLAKLAGVNIPVFTWAPAISMYDWVDEAQQLHNGIWLIDADGQRLPNGRMLDAIALAREYGYLI